MANWTAATVAGVALVMTGEFGLPIVITALTWYTGYPLMDG